MSFFLDRYVEVLLAVLLTAMGVVAAINWLNRKHGGFLKGWAGAVFIAIGWMTAMAYVLLKVRS
jgi:hypothetical protein